MFVDAGVRDVQVSAEAVVVRDFALFSATTDLPAIGRQAVDDGLVGRTALDDAVAAAEREAASDASSRS
jgi:hypothetical protein